MENLLVNEFAELFGTDKNNFSLNIKNLIEKYNFNYNYVVGKDYDNLILKILQKIEEDKQIIGSLERTSIWENGWKENLDKFKINNNEEDLIPKFIRFSKYLRLKQRYILTENKYFELNFLNVYRTWLFENYLKSFHNIYEFGCGTGFNLIEIAKLFPDKKLFGSDFVKSSVDLVNYIAKTKKIILQAQLFDMLNPDFDYMIKPNSAVITFGSLEQLASKIDLMIDYLLFQKPDICIHTEPALELYNPEILSDFLAIRFQSKRGYTKGLISKLETLEKSNIIKIIKVKRLNFGSLFMEGYNLIIWKPLK